MCLAEGVGEGFHFKDTSLLARLCSVRDHELCQREVRTNKLAHGPQASVYKSAHVKKNHLKVFNYSSFQRS